MKKKLFYLFAALLMAGACVFLSSCREPELTENFVCYCTYNGQYPKVYKYDWVRQQGYNYCSQLEEVLQKRESDHKVTCEIKHENDVE